MAYEVLGEIKVVQLGGVNKTTGKKNPSELEGYYLGYEQRPNKYNPERPKNFYKFQTAAGDVGIYATADLDKKMKSAVLGRMMKVVATGETLDVGKGNPMKLYLTFQDKSNTIDVSEESVFTSDAAESDISGSYEEVELPEESEEDEEVVHPPARPVAPRIAAHAPDPARQAKIQALLNKSKSKAS